MKNITKKKKNLTREEAIKKTWEICCGNYFRDFHVVKSTSSSS